MVVDRMIVDVKKCGLLVFSELGGNNSSSSSSSSSSESCAVGCEVPVDDNYYIKSYDICECFTYMAD